MFHINDHFQKLPGSYLFAEIARRMKAWGETEAGEMPPSCI